MHSSESLIATAESGEREAAEALRVMTDRYEVGMCTLTDLLEAQSQWHSARSNIIEAKRNIKSMKQTICMQPDCLNENDTEVSRLHHNAFDMLYRLNNMAMQQLK